MGNREHIYEIIAGNIRKERRRLGMTQAELAERAESISNSLTLPPMQKELWDVRRGRSKCAYAVL